MGVAWETTTPKFTITRISMSIFEIECVKIEFREITRYLKVLNLTNEIHVQTGTYALHIDST